MICALSIGKLLITFRLALLHLKEEQKWVQ
ncbi:MAG: hypothetical protein RJA41_783 [Actinomycetota bacterium]